MPLHLLCNIFNYRKFDVKRNELQTNNKDSKNLIFKISIYQACRFSLQKELNVSFLLDNIGVKVQ